ncbi:MAG TPA: YeeE/YedE thiosulfate transporter family protein [Rhodoblastus sp.]|nr:YeeE/YedE thiosulfate transporter family protein [Rhodoblastus sp.]
MTWHAILTLLLAVFTGMALARANMCFMKASKAMADGRFEPLAAMVIVMASATLAFTLWGYFGLRDPAPWAPPTAWSLVGAILFGIGARVNGACTIGTMGRLANGDMGALATIAGGAAALLLVPHAARAENRPRLSMTYEAGWTAIVLAAAAFALVMLARSRKRLERARDIVLLGAVAASLYGLRGETSLMDAASSLAPRSGEAVSIALVLAGLLVGVLAAAAWRGHFRPHLPDKARIPFEFAGGALMTTGALAIPGASDVVAFYGVPSGSPHAVVAWLVMLATVVLSFRVTRTRLWRGAFARNVA